jgi:hypothetical protein
MRESQVPSHFNASMNKRPGGSIHARRGDFRTALRFSVVSVRTQTKAFTETRKKLRSIAN